MLCEKPLASNAAEAERMAEAAKRTGHAPLRSLPLALPPALRADEGDHRRAARSAKSRHIETRFCVPLLLRATSATARSAGGATMDTGCYAIHLLRHLAGAEPEVLGRAGDSCSRPRSTAGSRPSCASRTAASGRVVCSLFSAHAARARRARPRRARRDARPEPDRAAPLPPAHRPNAAAGRAARA